MHDGSVWSIKHADCRYPTIRAMKKPMDAVQNNATPICVGRRFRTVSRPSADRQAEEGDQECSEKRKSIFEETGSMEGQTLGY